LCAALVIVLTVLALEEPGANSTIAKLAAVTLVPLNFSLLAVLKERGMMTFDGLLKVGIVAAQATAVWWIAQGNGPNLGALFGRSSGFGIGAGLPSIAQLSFALGALALVALVFSRRTRVEQGL